MLGQAAQLFPGKPPVQEDQCMAFFPRLRSCASLKLQPPTAGNPWSKQTKAVCWGTESRATCARQGTMLLLLARLSGQELGSTLPAQLTACCFPRAAAHRDISGLCQALFPLKSSPWEATEAHHDTALEASLIWSNRLRFLTACRADLQGWCQEKASLDQPLSSLSHTHPSPSFSRLFFPLASAATRTMTK